MGSIGDVKVQHHGWYGPELTAIWFMEAAKVFPDIQRVEWRLRAGTHNPILVYRTKAYKLVDDGRNVAAVRVLPGEIDPLSMRVPLPPGTPTDAGNCMKFWIYAAQAARLGCRKLPAGTQTTASFRGLVECEGRTYELHLVQLKHGVFAVELRLPT